MLSEIVLSQAKTLGYSYQNLSERVSKIFPCQIEESWTLIYNAQDFRWILSVNNIPQLILSDTDAIDFLKWRASIYSRV